MNISLSPTNNSSAYSSNNSLNTLVSEAESDITQSQILASSKVRDLINTILNSHEFPDSYKKYKNMVKNREYRRALNDIFKDLHDKYEVYRSELIAKNVSNRFKGSNDEISNQELNNHVEELKIREGIAEMVTFMEYLLLKQKINNTVDDPKNSIINYTVHPVSKEDYYLTTKNISKFNKSLDEDRELQRMLERAKSSKLSKSMKRGGSKKNKRKTIKAKKNFLYNPNDPKKSFDVYIDKDPSDTIPIKYTNIEDVKDTITKLEKLYKNGKYPHKRIWQVGMIMKVRLEAIKNNKEKLYPNAKNVLGRYNLANKYFLFLSKRTKLKEEDRKKLVFKF